MRLVYQGIHAEGVELTDLPGTFVVPGDVVEVPDELGERYLEQPVNWRPADDDESTDVLPNDQFPAPPPPDQPVNEETEVDPELERLLAEEAEIERASQEAKSDPAGSADRSEENV